MALIVNKSKQGEVVTMSKYTKEQIIKLVKENDVKFIRLQFTDIFGMLKT